ILNDKIENGNSEKSPSQHCRISVIDNGIGFNSLYNEKIFTILQKLENKLLFPGTGIGLAICKKVVTLHHGSITAKGLEKGSQFTIALPVRQT
ncbi:MAG: ATP-binding protein, partial [Nostoc sp.]